MAVIDIVKDKHDTQAHYTITKENNVIGQASHDLSLAWAVPIVGVYDNLNYSLVPYTLKDLFSVGAPMGIIQNEIQIGLVRSATVSDQVRLKGADYFRLEIDNRIFNAYVIGFGRKGKWLCVYEVLPNNEELALQINIPIKVKDWLPKYTIYALDNSIIPYAVYLTLYFDYFNEEHWLDSTSKSIKYKIKITTDKKIKARFDPDFNIRASS